VADTSRRVKHVVTNIRLWRTGADQAESACIFTAYEVFDDSSPAPSPIAVGDYIHRFERRGDGRWLIAERIATW
ncbi:MAG: hypothetical protein WAW17_10355, partial [Rhodococcus sp. (in: high G+C Gram-positive bacteria)]|uniref:nuclear transport factor 2 family protein n=1 Tax=Rhodococcus sp. TaxID=1831 RepID=UPI003BB0720E